MSRVRARARSAIAHFDNVEHMVGVRVGPRLDDAGRPVCKVLGNHRVQLRADAVVRRLTAGAVVVSERGAGDLVMWDANNRPAGRAAADWLTERVGRDGIDAVLGQFKDCDVDDDQEGS